MSQSHKKPVLCIGLDAGRSAVKVVAQLLAEDSGQRQEFVFPSASCPAKALTDEEARKAAEAETVLIDGQAYWVGETAMWQGRFDQNTALHDDWFFTNEHAALIRWAIARCRAELNCPNAHVVASVGLPSRSFQTDRSRYATHLAKAVSGDEQITVLPQAVGPFYALALTAEGKDCDPAAFDPGDQYAIVEIGQYTTDMVMLSEAVPLDHSYASCDGMYSAATAIMRKIHATTKVSLDLPKATKVLETGFYRRFGQDTSAQSEIAEATSTLASGILGRARVVFGDEIHSCRNVLVAGGGAELVGPHLQREWTHVRILDNPRFAVAEGFSRFACAIATAGSNA